MQEISIEEYYPSAYAENSNTPTFDLSHEYSRQTIIADGNEQYQGHPTTVLMPDGKTVFCVWTIGHGGPCGPIKKSTDGGLTWSELLPVPDSWSNYVNCPCIWHLPTDKAPNRLVIYAQDPETRMMYVTESTDLGDSWSSMQACGIISVMPMTTIIKTSGNRLLGMTNARSTVDKDPMSNVIIKTWSEDNGLSWSKPEVVVDITGAKLGEPWIITSPDKQELACLLRVNNRNYNSMIMYSKDSGDTWTKPVELPLTLTGDRHIGKYLPDGRIIVAFRDVAKSSPSYGHFCCWIGTWDDLKKGNPGQFRVKLMQHYAEWPCSTPDCGYPGLEVFDVGSVLATTYLKYRPHDRYNSVVCVRFNPALIETKKGIEV